MGAPRNFARKYPPVLSSLHRKLDVFRPQSLRYPGMTTTRNPAHEAKAMLGPTGELKRVAALAFVYPREKGWIVKAPDSKGGPELFVTGFIGPKAMQRAVEYGCEKYSGVLVLDHEP
jgi:hypothetical protein